VAPGSSNVERKLKPKGGRAGGVTTCKDLRAGLTGEACQRKAKTWAGKPRPRRPQEAGSGKLICPFTRKKVRNKTVGWGRGRWEPTTETEVEGKETLAGRGVRELKWKIMS